MSGRAEGEQKEHHYKADAKDTKFHCFHVIYFNFHSMGKNSAELSKLPHIFNNITDFQCFSSILQRIFTQSI